jgi:hypothetical protein
MFLLHITALGILIAISILIIGMGFQGKVLSQNDSSLVTTTSVSNQSNISSLTIQLTNISNQTAIALTNVTNLTELSVNNLTDILRNQIDLAYSLDWPVK